MYRPPAVRYEVARSRWYAVAVIALCAWGALTTAHFVLQTSSWVFQWAVGVTLVSAAFWSAWGWTHAPQGTLRWDGAHWHWSAWDDVPVERLQLLMDWQFVVVLRLRSESGQHFLLWLERRRPHTTWRAMRRALVSHHRHATHQGRATAPLDGRALP
jgi:hypothetical protein